MSQAVEPRRDCRCGLSRAGGAFGLGYDVALNFGLYLGKQLAFVPFGGQASSG